LGRHVSADFATLKVEEELLRSLISDPSMQLIFTHRLNDDSDAPPTGPLWELDGLLDYWMDRIEDTAEGTTRGPAMRWSRRRLPKPFEVAMYARFQDERRIMGVEKWRMEYRRLIAGAHPLPTVAEVAEHLSLPLISATH
jgi:hypothetical protein